VIVKNPAAQGAMPASAVTVPTGSAAGAGSGAGGAGAVAASGAAASVARSAYLRAVLDLTKPGITRMVLVTTAAGFYLASVTGFFNFGLLLHTLFGTALAASGCNALNQVAEHRNDALMPRTARRPLPSGRLGHQQALVLSTTLAVVGLLYLLVMVNPPTAALVALTISSYVMLYTPLKQRTWHATTIGAVPGALPILAGWTAGGGTIDALGLTLFGILFFWQLPHFYALAWIFREDYRLGGFRLLPHVEAGERKLAQQVVLHGVLLLPVSVLPTVLGLTGTLYLVGALLLGAAFLGLGIALAVRLDEQRAWRLFYGSIIYLPVLLLLMVIDKL
jgi:heme o synthase